MRGRVRIVISDELLLSALYLDTDLDALDVGIVAVRRTTEVPNATMFILSSDKFPDDDTDDEDMPLLRPTFRRENIKLTSWGFEEDTDEEHS